MADEDSTVVEIAGESASGILGKKRGKSMFLL
jgi:hypothetical protein